MQGTLFLPSLPGPRLLEIVARDIIDPIELFDI